MFKCHTVNDLKVCTLAALLMASMCACVSLEGVLTQEPTDVSPSPSVSDSSQNSVQPTPSPTISSRVGFNSTYVDEIGKTYNLIKRENPDFVYQKIGLPDSQGQFFGLPDGKYSCFFYGAQTSPTLDEISDKYGDELICTGIISTVGEMFTDTIEQMPLEQFFETYQITEYTYMAEDVLDQGWIRFTYNDLFVWINTNDTGTNSAEFEATSVMKRIYPVMFIDLRIADNNDRVLQEIWGY